MKPAADRLGRTPLPTIGLLLALLGVCAVAAGGQAGVGAALGAAGKPAAALALVGLTATGILGLVVLALVLRAIGLIGPPPDERIPWNPIPAGRLARVIAVIAPLIVAVALIVMFSGLMHVGGRNAGPPAPQVGNERQATTPSPVGTPPSSSGGFDTAAKIEVAVGAALALAALAFALRRIRQKDQTEDAGLKEDTGLQEAATRALRASSAIADPREAVIAAYAAMESELAERGLARRPPEAPFEYVARTGTVRGGGLERLAELFELARFSRQAIDVRARNEAEALLASLRDS